jgi:hypothetical protein
MPEGQTKCKIVSFRMGDEEYLKVETLAKNKGFSSVSFFAREATLKAAPLEVVHTPLDVEMNRLWRRIEAVTVAIEKILGQITLAHDARRIAD